MAIKYTIVMGKTAYGLEAEVNKYVAKGYQPTGGLCSNHDGSLLQAMVIMVRPVSRLEEIAEELSWEQIVWLYNNGSSK